MNEQLNIEANVANIENDEPQPVSYRGYKVEPRPINWHGKIVTRYVILDTAGSTGNAALTLNDAQAIIDRMIARDEAIREIEERNAAATLIRELPEVREALSVISNARKLGRYSQAQVDAMLV